MKKQFRKILPPASNKTSVPVEQIREAVRAVKAEQEQAKIRVTLLKRATATIKASAILSLTLF